MNKKLGNYSLNWCHKHQIKYASTPTSTGCPECGKEKNKKESILLLPGLIFTKTALGEAVFIHEGDNDGHDAIRPGNWTPDELRKMADFMDKNLNCTIFDDGSGNPIHTEEFSFKQHWKDDECSFDTPVIKHFQ